MIQLSTIHIRIPAGTGNLNQQEEVSSYMSFCGPSSCSSSCRWSCEGWWAWLEGWGRAACYSPGCWSLRWLWRKGRSHRPPELRRRQRDGTARASTGEQEHAKLNLVTSISANLLMEQACWLKGFCSGVSPAAALSQVITYICSGPAGCVGGLGCSMSCCGLHVGDGSSCCFGPSDGCFFALLLEKKRGKCVKREKKPYNFSARQFLSHIH